MADKTVVFVQLIENYQCLYNNTLQEYSRKDVIEKAWAEISRTMDWTVADCKEKWKNIRNGFVRSLKPSPSGSASKPKKLYYLHDIMQFILPYVRPVQHAENTGNIVQTELNTEPIIQPDEDDGQSNVNDCEPNTEQHNDERIVNVAKRKQETQAKAGKKKVRKEQDDVDIAVLQYISDKKENKSASEDRKMFLLSLLPDVSSLSVKNLRQFKIKTLMLLEDMLTQQEQVPVLSQPQAMMDTASWSASASNSGTSYYISPPGPSPTSSSMSPRYNSNPAGYEFTNSSYNQ